MYIVGVLMMFVMTLLGVGGVELSIAFEHGQAMRSAAHVAATYINTAESDYVIAQTTSLNAGTGLVLTPLSSGQPVALCTSTAGAAPNGAHVKSGADGSVCNYYGAWTVTTTNATALNTAVGTGEETSSNINIGVNEQRVAATIVVKITRANGDTLATKTRTVTLRTLPLAPYISISDSADSHDPFITGTGTIGGTNGTADGDPAGCVLHSGCGDATTIATYAECPTSGAPIPAQNAMWAAWCANQAGLTGATADGGTYTPTGAAPGTWQPVDASTYVSKQWNNAGDTAVSGN
jgi:hypothetical protein